MLNLASELNQYISTNNGCWTNKIKDVVKFLLSKAHIVEPWCVLILSISVSTVSLQRIHSGANGLHNSFTLETIA